MHVQESYKKRILKMVESIDDAEYLKILYSFIDAYLKRRKGD